MTTLLMPAMYPGAACDVGITARSRERPWCRRTLNVADELASNVTCFRITVPLEVSRSTSTYLPVKGRLPVTVTEKLPLVVLDFSTIRGRTLTVTVELVVPFQLAW